MSREQLQQFDWTAELHQTMVKSLTTTFGLDFLLLKDKNGGDVDTIHNVRQGIYATEKEKQAYDNRGEYDSHAYHKDSNYIAKGRSDKAAQQKGELHDRYRNATMALGEKRQLDHIVSASETHHDAGRILAEIDGVVLANQDSNFSSTLSYINTKKSNKKMTDFVNEMPSMIEKKQQSIVKHQAKLDAMPESTPQERHEKQQMRDKVRKEQQHIEALESVDKDAMLKADKEARAVMDAQISRTYYSSSKFFGSTAVASLNQGASMGARQALGLVLAEIWFELKEQLPKLYRECRQNFRLEDFLGRIVDTLKNIWQRVQKRFRELLTTFKDGFFGGILSSITTTVFNIFATVYKNAIKLIRESWQSLVQAIKLVFFNPQSLSTGELMRELTRIISTAVATSLGVMLNQYLSNILTFPFGSELAAFVGALATGLMVVGMTYVLDHSELMQKVWDFLDTIKGKYQKILEHYQEINAELDRYLSELSKLEFNMNTDELQMFADGLSAVNSEYARGLVLNAEVKRRGIELPFEAGNTASGRNWLNSLK